METIMTKLTFHFLKSAGRSPHPCPLPKEKVFANCRWRLICNLTMPDYKSEPVKSLPDTLSEN